MLRRYLGSLDWRWLVGSVVMGGLPVLLRLAADQTVLKPCVAVLDASFPNWVLWLWAALILLGLHVIQYWAWRNQAKRSDELQQATALSDGEREQLIDAMKRAGTVYAMFFDFYINNAKRPPQTPSQNWKATVYADCEVLGRYARTMAYHGNIAVLLETMVNQSVTLLDMIEHGWFSGNGVAEMGNLVDAIRWSRDGIMAYANQILGRSSDIYKLPLKPPTPY